MTTFITTKSLLTICCFLAIALACPNSVSGQKCDCKGLCCSKYGYCGMGGSYCGEGCREGPCDHRDQNGVKVADVVTVDFFNGIINQAAPDCPGRGFYTRDSFLQALDTFRLFGTEGSIDDSKREIAAFFAHVAHETNRMCYKEENGDRSAHCDQVKYPQYPCNQDKAYFGRGPLQLSWNYNYGPAGEALGFDGLNNPEIVANDQVTSFKAALWFWRTFVHGHLVSGQGFGETIRAINGEHECGGKNQAAIDSRVRYYIEYCNKFKVDPGANLQC